MSARTFWTPAWAEILRDCINGSTDSAERAQSRRPKAYWEWAEASRHAFAGQLALGIRDLPPGGRSYLLLTFDGGSCVAAEFVDAAGTHDATYVLLGSQKDWDAVRRDGDLLHGFLFQALRIESGDPVLFFRNAAFFIELVRCLAKVPTAPPDSAAA